jgi:hypothetical protein
VLRRGSTLACALVLAVVAVLGFGSDKLRRAFQSGSPGTYWVLAAGAVGLAVSVFLVLSAKRPKYVAGWLAACIALPQLASLASSVWSGNKIDAAITETIGDVVPRIVAEGTSELTLAVALADLFSVAIAATIAIGLAERRAIDKRALAVGGAWLAASIVLFAIGVRGHEIALRPLVPVMVAAMAAVLVMSREDDLAPLVALAALVAVCLLERAIAERERATAFGAIAMEDVTLVDQARALAGYLDVRAHLRVAMAVHVLLGASTFLVARGFPKKVSTPAIAIIGLVAATSFYEQRAFVRRMSSARNAFEVGVPLPTTRAQSGWFVSGSRFVVTRDGVLREDVFPGSDEPEDPRPGSMSRVAKPVFADEALTCGALAAALEPKIKNRQSFALVALHPPDNVPRPSVADLEPLVGDRQLVGLGFDIGHRHYPRIDAVVTGGDTFVLKLPGEPDLAFALDVDPDEVARAVKARRPELLPKRDTVQLTMHPTDTVRRLAAALAILAAAFPMEGKWQHRYFALRIE